MTFKFIEMILKFDLETKIRKGEKLIHIKNLFVIEMTLKFIEMILKFDLETKIRFIEMILKFDLETKIRKGEKLKCLFDTTSF
jgi:CRISPR/Cas system-associated protein endoribonuclease Cas2